MHTPARVHTNKHQLQSTYIYISKAVQGPAVEFFNPKMRRELEKKDEESKRTSGKGGAPGTDDWSYLNSFSRVPVSIDCLFSVVLFTKT